MLFIPLEGSKDLFCSIYSLMLPKDLYCFIFFPEISKDLYCFIYSFGRIERSIYSFGSIKESILFYLKASTEPIYFLFLLLCFQKNLYCSIYSFKSIKEFILLYLFFWMDQKTYIILFKRTKRTYIIYLFKII